MKAGLSEDHTYTLRTFSEKVEMNKLNKLWTIKYQLFNYRYDFFNDLSLKKEWFTLLQLS